METPQHHPIIIVGAGPAGLAIATCLKELKLPVLILEEAERVASQWSKHYDRLHLHTHKNYSHLPGLKFPKNVPVFPSRKQVLDYMENYAKIFKHEPRFKTKVLSAIRQGEIWHIKTNQLDIYINIFIALFYTLNKRLNLVSSPSRRTVVNMVHI